MNNEEEPKRRNWLLAGGLGAAFVGSLCCIGPAIFIALGLGGFAAGAFFETIRPWMGALAVIALAFAWRHTLRRKPCCDGACETQSKRNGDQIALLSIGSLLAVGLLAFPYLSERTLEARNANIAETSTGMTQLTVSIPSMDCASCAVGIQNKLATRKGIESERITYETKLANISYDPSQTSEGEILAVIESTGFPPEPLKAY